MVTEREHIEPGSLKPSKWLARPPEVNEVVPLETFTIVMPCAFEYDFAELTVWSFWNNTNHSRIKEMIIVDDGSNPPLRTVLSSKLLAGGPDMPPLKIIRHEEGRGLIVSRKVGGDMATGDVVAFFDCHVLPRRGWEEGMLAQLKRAGDHRTVVMPAMSIVDPDAWREVDNPSIGVGCMMSWYVHFPWIDLERPRRDVPVLQGSMIVLSKRWWQESGGYDDLMVGWGGENIEQSLRIWLCGGRIELAENAVIAHMYRVSSNKKTRRQYKFDDSASIRNRLRAVFGWMGEFAKKVATFPYFKNWIENNGTLLDMTFYSNIQKKLSCAPFTSYLQHFRSYYLDTGYIPAEVFQIKEKSTGLCLQKGFDDKQLYLTSCAAPDDKGETVADQSFHLANRNVERQGECCSGIAHWNTRLCLKSSGLDADVSLTECGILGHNNDQLFQFPNSGGQLLHQDACLAPVIKTKASPVSSCSVSVKRLKKSKFVRGKNSQTIPKRFMLRSETSKSLCGTVSSNLRLVFEPCNATNPQQHFRAKRFLHGFQVRAGTSKACLDSHFGEGAVIWACGTPEAPDSANQIWTTNNSKLIWNDVSPQRLYPSMCLDADDPELPLQQKSFYSLEVCSKTASQTLKRVDSDDEGTFLLSPDDGNLCLGPDKMEAGSSLGLEKCSLTSRWHIKNRHQIQHLVSDFCLENQGMTGLILAPCMDMDAQKFRTVAEHGWVQTLGDRGYFSRCLDREPVRKVELSVVPCNSASEKGIYWERFNSFVPLETQIWNAADKPPAGTPPLGSIIEW